MDNEGHAKGVTYASPPVGRRGWGALRVWLRPSLNLAGVFRLLAAAVFFSFSIPVDSIHAQGSAGLSDLSAMRRKLADPAPIVWLFTGDSVTQGAKWTGSERSYPEIVSERIRWEMSRRRDIVINTAISGNKVDDILADFSWRVGQLHPDVVSVMIGMNDSVRGPSGERQFEISLAEFVRRVRSLGAIPILHTTNSTLFDPQRVDLPAYNAIIEKLALEQQVILVDNWRYWRSARTQENLTDWLGNPIHPNGRGHAAIAGKFFRVLGIYDAGSPMCRLGG
ncbi:MAG TPA: SGNH/GDSL hydrolase family protein [Acidobacteriaceae bacterium]|nr:SGNH/GDSL hydrolase family protein [Acidobacteriaceae bacterium]